MSQSQDAGPPDDPGQRFRAEAWPHLASLLRVARMLTHDADRAEDLAQETMLRALRHIDSYRSGTDIKAWLMTILRRTHIDLFRRESRRITAGSLDAMRHDPEADADPTDADWTEPDEILSRFADEAIEDAVRSLAEPMRWTLLLLDVEQMPVAEAAAALEVPEGTVKSRASRARAQLRRTLLPEARRRGWLPNDAGV